MKKINSSWVLLPFLAFIITFLAAGILTKDFYALPASMAVMVGSILAFILYKDPLSEKVNVFIKGCGDDKIMIMCIIYLLAGAFATVSKASGGVDAVVNIGLQVLSSDYLPLGIFIIASFLSLATGTSVGAIVALGPIAIGLAEKSGVSLPLMSGALLGGAMFGDNLSVISDTTIAATQSVGCAMKDKFRANGILALIAAIITIIILLVVKVDVSTSVPLQNTNTPISYIAVLPYFVVIILASIGLDVFVVLVLGILLAGVIGLFQNNFSVLAFAKIAYEGFLSMIDIFLLSMLTGGLAALVDKKGGIQYILNGIKKKVSTGRGAQIGIASLVSFTNMAIANNTVSIVITGPVAKELADEYQLEAPKVASILDIFACVVQGILPYGAQVLLLIEFSNQKLDYMSLAGSAYYLHLLFFITIISIFIPKKNKI